MIFFDLEPTLGSSDHIWNDMVAEHNNYPFRSEAGYVLGAHNQTNQHLKKEYVKFLRSKKQGDEHTKIYFNSQNPIMPQSWTDEWDNSVHDTRITLVARSDSVDNFFEQGHVLEERLQYFPKTWEYIQSLPIKEIYNAIFINGVPGTPLASHIDWKKQRNPVDEKKVHMVFINPMNNRPFYYKDGDRKIFTNSSLFLFGNSNAEHGILAENHRTSLIRIYCALDDDFCDRIGIYKVGQ